MSSYRRHILNQLGQGKQWSILKRIASRPHVLVARFSEIGDGSTPLVVVYEARHRHQVGIRQAPDRLATRNYRSSCSHTINQYTTCLTLAIGFKRFMRMQRDQRRV